MGDLKPSADVKTLREAFLPYASVGKHLRSTDIAQLVKQLRTIGEMCAELEEELAVTQRAQTRRLVAVGQRRNEPAVIVAGRRLEGLSPVIQALASAWETYDQARGSAGERQAYLNLNLRLNALQAALKGA